jgi:hypothetical protein
MRPGAARERRGMSQALVTYVAIVTAAGALLAGVGA